MIKIIGTTHLISKEAIEGIIKDESPDILCLELCDFRAHIVINKIKEGKSNNTLLGKMTSKLKQKAEKEGLEYGSDQNNSLMFAINNNIEYKLVDMPILKIQELFNKIPKEEQSGFQRELTEFESESISKEIDEDKVLVQLKERYPIAFEFLVNMRNLYITKELLKVMVNNKGKKILVILGKGHVKRVEGMLK